MAGVEEEAPERSVPSSWTQQVERSYKGASIAQSSRTSYDTASSPKSDRNTMVRIVGYDGGGGARPAHRTPMPVDDQDYGRGNYGGSIAGEALAPVVTTFVDHHASAFASLSADIPAQFMIASFLCVSTSHDLETCR